MQVNSMLKATTAALALILTASASQAATRTWDGDVSTDANAAANWSGDVLPTSSDLAVIVLPGNNRLPTLTGNLTVGALNVQQNAKITTDIYTLTVVDSAGLDVDPSAVGIEVSRQATSPFTGGMLKLTGGGTHQIDSLVDVRGVFWIDSANATFQGNGSFKLNNGSARMDISNGLTATYYVLVQGRGTIQPASGNATFVLAANSTYLGMVDANASGPLAFAAAMSISDSSANGVLPVFRASTSASAILRFNQDANLVADFEIEDCATIDINQATVDTTGSLQVFEGHIMVDTGEYFELEGSFHLFNGPGTWDSGDC